MEGLYIIIAFNLVNMILALIFHNYCKRKKVKHMCLDNPIFIFSCFLGFIGTGIILLVMYIEVFSKKLYD